MAADPTEFMTMIGDSPDQVDVLPYVYVHAMNGLHDFRTMIITISIKGKVVQVLIGIGSSHNFLDLNTDKRLEYVLREFCN